MPVHQHVFPSTTTNLFPHHRCLYTVFMQPKLAHALLASERGLIDLQQVLSWRVTNALLKSNQAPFTNDLITC